MSVSIGWVGAGKLGGVMVRRLVNAGIDVMVCDTDPAVRAAMAGTCRIVPTLADLAGQRTLVFSTIPDDDALRAIALGDSGLLANLPSDAIFADMSTVSPEASAEIAEAARAREVAYLRAPVSGSVVLAETGTLTILASGPHGAFKACEPVFRHLSARQFLVGESEEARYLKLVINNMIGTTAAMYAESLALGRKGGLDWAVMLDVIAESAAASPLIKYKTAPLKARDFAPAFSTAQMIKDMALFTQAAGTNGCETPLAELTLKLFHEQAEAGMAEDDFFSAVRLMERKAGLA